MKSVLISIQPYYVFLIIARKMGWNIPQEKTIEVRKDYPKDKDWNKVTHIYCSKNRKSFNRIPAKYQPLMEKFLGKVIGEFVCDRIVKYDCCEDLPYDKYFICENEREQMCLDWSEIEEYGQDKPLYGLHISDLKIYDKPKELGEFRKGCNDRYDPMYGSYCNYCNERCKITRPPMSWCYVEEL